MRTLQVPRKKQLLKKIDEEGKLEKLDKKPKSLVRSKRKWRKNTDERQLPLHTTCHSEHFDVIPNIHIRQLEHVIPEDESMTPQVPDTQKY